MFAKIKTASGTEIHHSIESLTGNPLKYKMDNFIVFVSIKLYGIIHQNEKGPSVVR